MLADIPPWLADLGAGAGAIAAILGLLLLVVGIITRTFRHGAQAFHEATVATIREEIPTAVAAAMPQVTRELVRGEVDRAIEPHAAQLRSELRHVREQMQPNGGSSFSDRLNARMDSLERGQRKIFAHLDASGSLADADDPDDDTGQT